MFKPCCKKLFERIASHFEVSLDELLDIADPKPIIKVNSTKCLARIQKDKAIIQCTRPRKKGQCLCDIHLKKSNADGLTFGMLQDVDSSTGTEPKAKPLVEGGEKQGIEVRLMTYRGVEYFYDYKTSRMYDVDTHKLVGIMTEKNVLEFDKAYVI
jgi:hypothetical protein